jgi:hypothetical protein
VRPLLLVLLGACSGDGHRGGELSYAEDIDPLFLDYGCYACHAERTGDPADGGLDLSGDPVEALVGVPSTQSLDMVLVEPGDHLYSYVWNKLNGTQSIAGGSGTSMPLGGAMTEAEIDLVAEWIDAGANP